MVRLMNPIAHFLRLGYLFQLESLGFYTRKFESIHEVSRRGHGRGTAMMQEWNIFKQRNPKARLVCIDIQPYGTTQAAEREDILNIGGFSDQVFQIITDFANGSFDDGHWVKVIESVKL